jgi:hypothetical protein
MFKDVHRLIENIREYKSIGGKNSNGRNKKRTFRKGL